MAGASKSNGCAAAAVHDRRARTNAPLTLVSLRFDDATVFVFWCWAGCAPLFPCSILDGLFLSWRDDLYYCISRL